MVQPLAPTKWFPLAKPQVMSDRTDGGQAALQEVQVDFFVLGQAALLGFVGLSILTVCVGFTVRVFLGPVLRDVAERLANKPTRDESLLLGRMEQLDDRLASLEGGIDRLEAAHDFDRRLATGGPMRSETV
jgi:hypothetical protein